LYPSHLMMSSLIPGNKQGFNILGIST